MLFQKPVQIKLALGTHYFTKEFPGFEIESKWKLRTENPVPTVLEFVSDIHSGLWGCFSLAKTMGKLSVGVRFFEFKFDFWAIPIDSIPRKGFNQVAMVAGKIGTNLHQVAFKTTGSRLRFEEIMMINPPLIRPEDRKGDWISEQETISRIRYRHPAAEKIASITRQKCYAYIQSGDSYRNFSISADLCYSGSETLSQVEIEYKGRSGIWLPDTTGHQIVLDFKKIHMILVERYNHVLEPTTQTKFQWITKES